MEDARVALTPDPLSPESTLVFSVMFLYPMDAQTDFIKAFSEMDCINDHLEYLLPLALGLEARISVCDGGLLYGDCDRWIGQSGQEVAVITSFVGWER